MIEQIKQAVFAAENVLNWTPEETGQLFYNVARLQSQYNEAATLWATANYPSTQAVTVAWLTGKSAAEAGLLWLQEINLSIESLKAHERDIDKRLSESEGHKLLREALREWYAFDPSRMDVVSMRMQFMATLTIEAKSDASKTKTHRIKTIDGGINVDGFSIALTSKQTELFRALIEASGEFVNLSKKGFRTRDVENLPDKAKAIIESQPGAGTRVYPQWFN